VGGWKYVGLAISDKKIVTAEDGIDGTIGFFLAEFRLFRGTENYWNSHRTFLWRRKMPRILCRGTKIEQTLRIPFRTIPHKRKQFGIPLHGTKIEANSWKSVLNHSTEEKQLGIPFRRTKLEENFRSFVPKHFAEENTLSILFART
jgi:hypothetical protein